MRFLITGGVCGTLQLVLLTVFEQHASALALNAAAFLISAQVNFTLSQAFTWRDRVESPWRQGLSARWLAFHGCIATSAVINLTVFATAQLVMPHVLAATAGILAGSVVNFVVNNRWTFRTPVASDLDDSNGSLAFDRTVVRR